MSDFQLTTQDLDRAMASLTTHRAVLALDSRGRIAAINQCYLRLTGFQRAEVIGSPIWMLLDLPERCAGRLSKFLDLPEAGEAHLPDLAHLSKHGRRFRVDARIFGVQDEVGQACLSMIFARPEEGGDLIDLRHHFCQPGDAERPLPVARLTKGRLRPPSRQRMLDH